MAYLGFGIGSCCVGAAFYLCRENNRRKAVAFESVTRVKQLKDLAGLLHDKLSLIVTFSGELAADKPLKCKRSGLEGLVVEETVRELFLEKKNFLKEEDDSTTQKQTAVEYDWVGSGLIQEEILWAERKKKKHIVWNQGTTLVSSTRNKVPLYLDDRTGRLRIEGVKLNVELTGIKEEFEPEASSQAVLEDAVGCLLGGKTKLHLGIEWTDRVFCYPAVGHSMTVVGEVYKDNEGTFSVRRPKNGPFHVAYGRKIDEIIADYKECAEKQKLLSLGFTVVGVSLILVDIIKLGFPIVLRRFDKENSS